jgi:putative endopeptidase
LTSYERNTVRSLILLCLAAGFAAAGFSQTAPLKGIETGDLDRKADPCSNFYQYANGSWRAQHPIPASMDRWSRRWEAGEANKDQLRVILDDVSSHPDQPKGTPGQLTGDFYAACTNQTAIDKAGLTPLLPMLQKISEIRDLAGLQSVIIELQADGITAPFYLYGQSDLHDPQNVIADVGAAGLGLPDRDYYLKPEQRFADARAGYLKHVANILQLAGASDSEAAASAKTIMAFETALAKASLDNVALRDPASTDHKMGFDQLQQLTPHFDWAAYYRAAAVSPAPLNVEQPAFLKEFERQLTSTSIPDWKVYLRWQVLNNFADNLSSPFVDEHFAFFQKQLAGVGELKPRPIRCSEQTDALLGEALGQEYVKRHFPPEAKVRAREMVGNIISAMHDTIQNLDWMTPETKQKALQKLSTLNVKVGYPDKWKDYSSVTITRTGYFDDVLSASQFMVRDIQSTIGKPVDRNRWGMTPPTSNAYYNSRLNEIVFPAGILQPPAFSVNYVDAVNYGAIGVVIGHEISHGFDDQGSKFDAQGRLSNWWNAEDNEKFQAKTACVAHQFDGYTIDGGGDIHINGKLVLGESIGDLAGLKIAYLAFQKSQQGKPPAPTIDGFTPDQQFFIAWGQFRGDETRPETQKLMVQGDPHPVAKYRVIGPLSNFAPFAQAFQCKPGSKMVRPDEVRCVVW